MIVGFLSVAHDLTNSIVAEDTVFFWAVAIEDSVGCFRNQRYILDWNIFKRRKTLTECEETSMLT